MELICLLFEFFLLCVNNQKRLINQHLMFQLILQVFELVFIQQYL